MQRLLLDRYFIHRFFCIQADSTHADFYFIDTGPPKPPHIVLSLHRFVFYIGRFYCINVGPYFKYVDLYSL